MIPLTHFAKTETTLIHLAKLWNKSESNPAHYDMMFVSNPHELAALIGQNTTYNDWQVFLSDSRVQEYVDKIIYTQAGIIINQYFKDDVHLTQAASARLNTAIKYRDDHKSDFAVPVQYIYCAVPLTPAERAFLPDDSKDEVL